MKSNHSPKSGQIHRSDDFTLVLAAVEDDLNYWLDKKIEAVVNKKVEPIWPRIQKLERRSRFPSRVQIQSAHNPYQHHSHDSLSLYRYSNNQPNTLPPVEIGYLGRVLDLA
jgi:hypothetical protein